ncbi:hypothetical protein Tco_1258191 [Tanacetum coccineum]
MYGEVFGLDVPLTQSQLTESTKGTHRTPSAPRSPNPKMDEEESSTPKWSTVIHFRLPERRSTRLTPPAPVPTVDKADDMILQETFLLSTKVEKSKKLEKILPPKNDEPNIPGTRLEPRSDKESPKVEITNDEEVEITNVVIPVNVNEEEEEITDEVYELKRREKGKIVKESRSTPFPTPIRSHRIHTDLVSSDTKKLHELTELQGRYTYLFEHLKIRFLSRKSFDTLADHLQEIMVESLPTMVDTHIKEQVKKQVRDQVPVYVAKGLILERQKTKEEMEWMIAKAILQERGNIQAEISSQIHNVIDNHIPSQVDASVPQTTCRTSLVRLRDQDDPHDDAHPEGENSAKRQKTSKYEAYTGSYASDDDEIPTKQVSQDIMEEVSLTIDEAKLKKIADEMLRQRCTSRYEHQYHIDQMKNFLKSDIVWESRKEIRVSPHPRKTAPLKGSSGPEKIVLSLHKFPTIIFNDDDIEEQTSRSVNKCGKKFNPYARYGVEH